VENKEAPKSDFALRLTSPKHVPFKFEVNIREANKSDFFGHHLEITGRDPVTGLRKTCCYSLADKAHSAYLDFYEKLAQDFGLRLPQNRGPQKKNFTAKIAYQEVLTQNLAPGILYGYGDPAVLRVQGNSDEDVWYYLLVTSNDAPNSFPILRSRNLTDWKLVNFVFPAGQKPVWAADGELVSDYWAPEMHQVKDEFWVYFVARDKHSRELCIGMAKAARPVGPFIPEEEPILRGNIIDPHVFVQEDGMAYLYWKEDNNDVWPGELIDLLAAKPDLISELFVKPEDQITASFILTVWPWARMLEPMERFQVIQVFIEAVITRYLDFYNQLSNLLEKQPASVQAHIRRVRQFMKTPMFAQLLSADGKQLVGNKTKILENDLEWEAHLVEGMWVTQQESKYYLFYAGNDFSTDQYGIGVAIADSPLGPYQKRPKPFLQSTAEWWAPGHPSVARGPEGKQILFLHAYYPGQAGYKQFRALLAVPLKFEKNQVLVD